MKGLNIYLVLVGLALVLAGCHAEKAVNDIPESVMDVVDVESIPDSSADSFVDEDFGDMEAVDNAITELISSDEYTNSEIDRRVELVGDLLKSLARIGTTERSYSLIKPLSIHYYKDSAMYSFEYKCGVEGGVMLQEFDSSFNDGLSFN